MITQSTNKKSLPGITLIEVLVYIGIFGIFFVTMVQFFFFLEDMNRQSSESLKIDRNVIFLTQHFESSFKTNLRVVDSATVFDNPSTEEDDLDGLLVLDPDSDDDPDNTVNYSVTLDGSLIFNNATELTRDDLRINKFTLESILDSEDNIIGVRITINISSRGGKGADREVTNSYIFE